MQLLILKGYQNENRVWFIRLGTVSRDKFKKSPFIRCR